MNPFLFVASVVFLAYNIRFSYLWWFSAKDYLQWTRKKRNEFRKKFWFMPQNLTFNFYDEHPSIEVLLNRLVGLFFITIGILGVIASIRGPFGPGD